VPVFPPYIKALDAGSGLSRRAATRAVTSLWLSLAVSSLVLWVAGRLPFWLAAIIVAAGGAGTATIVYYARAAAATRRDWRYGFFAPRN
jgi:hypothetical protein